jgi:hypothetical protein
LGRTITIPDVPQITEQQAGRAIEVVRQARDSIVAMIPQHKKPRKDRMESIQRLVEAEQVLSLNRAGLKPRAADFRVPTEMVAALRMRNQLDVQVKQLDEQLGLLDQWCIRRMVADLALLGNPEFAQRIPNSAQLAHHAAALLPTTRLLLSSLPERQNLQVKHAVLAVLLGQIEGNQEDSHFVNSVIGQSREVKDAANALRAKFKDVLYPFDHAKAGMTIDRFLLTDPLLDETAVGSVYEGAESVIDGLGTLAVRCLSQVLWVAEQVELAIGLPPLADPPDEDPE